MVFFHIFFACWEVGSFQLTIHGGSLGRVQILWSLCAISTVQLLFYCAAWWSRQQQQQQSWWKQRDRPWVWPRAWGQQGWSDSFRMQDEWWKHIRYWDRNISIRLWVRFSWSRRLIVYYYYKRWVGIREIYYFSSRKLFFYAALFWETMASNLAGIIRQVELQQCLQHPTGLYFIWGNYFLITQ